MSTEAWRLTSHGNSTLNVKTVDFYFITVIQEFMIGKGLEIEIEFDIFCYEH